MKKQLSFTDMNSSDEASINIVYGDLDKIKTKVSKNITFDEFNCWIKQRLQVNPSSSLIYKDCNGNEFIANGSIVSKYDVIHIELANDSTSTHSQSLVSSPIWDCTSKMSLVPSVFLISNAS